MNDYSLVGQRIYHSIISPKKGHYDIYKMKIMPLLHRRVMEVVKSAL
jgi:hypothetical protein